MALLLVTLVLVQAAVCQGFDFSFHSVAPTSGYTSGLSVCAVLQCAEILTDDQLDDARDFRQIVALTIYRRISADGVQWKQLARVNTAAPRDHRVSDGRRISGELTERQANLTLGLLKTADCTEAEFSCVAVLSDVNGKKSVTKSYVGGKHPSDLEPSVDGNDLDIARGFNPFSVAAGHSQEIGEIKQMVSSLLDKLNCLEKRFGDSSKRDDKLENQLETLRSGVTDRIHNLEISLRSQLDSSNNRLEDRLDRLENRLEDKLSQMSLGQPSNAGYKHFQNETSYQLSRIFDSIQSTKTTMNDIHDQVTTPAVSTADNKTRLVSGIDSLLAITQDLGTSVEALRPVCEDQASASVVEFFDVLGTGKKEWRLAFRGTAYNNVKIYPAYIHGTGIPVNVEPGCKQFNHSLPCVNHYRNRDAFENWASIDEVLLAVFNKGQVVKRIVFNGHGSTMTSWFEASRVILSSWGDLKTQSQNFFNIKGETRPQYMRRFFINHDYTECDTFRGWFFVGEALDASCPMDKAVARPFIQYAVGNSMAVWASSDVARADAFGVFLKYD